MSLFFVVAERGAASFFFPPPDLSTSRLLSPFLSRLTPRAILDEDTPGGGRHFCLPCSKYFISAAALAKHATAKPHKRRVAKVGGDAPRPHHQADADAAAGMGRPDNGDAGRRRAAAARGAAAGGADAVAAAATGAAVEGGLAGMAL